MDKVNFGFKKVDYKEKEKLVKSVFSSVASKYDLMNDVMSLGIHRLWKNKLIEQLEPNKKLLDMAAGTGDIAQRYYQKCQNPDITLCDINFDMLLQGKNKLIDQNIFKGLNFVCTNAENLPFDNDSFDYYTIAFGIRNVTNIDNALKEAYRVLKKGGKFICLEFSKIEDLRFAKLYKLYSFKLIPKIGALVAKDEESYRYLVESIELFPNQREFLKLIENSGFKHSNYFNLNMGIACLHIGFKG